MESLLHVFVLFFLGEMCLYCYNVIITYCYNVITYCYKVSDSRNKIVKFVTVQAFNWLGR